MSKDQQEIEEQLPTFLRDMREENPFQVPPTYFKHLSDETWRHVSAASHHTGMRFVPEGILSALKLVARSFRPTVVLGAVVLLIGLRVLWPTSSEDGQSAMALTENEIMEYLEANVDDFEVSELYTADALTMEDISSDVLGDPSEQLDLDPFYEDLVEDIDLEDIL